MFCVLRKRKLLPVRPNAMKRKRKRKKKQDNCKLFCVARKHKKKNGNCKDFCVTRKRKKKGNCKVFCVKRKCNYTKIIESLWRSHHIELKNRTDKKNGTQKDEKLGKLISGKNR